MKVKICGITNLEDAHLSYKYGADAIGFIFYEKSKRYIEPAAAKKIIETLPPFLIKVGVFVNEESHTINNTAKDLHLNFVQLHGDEERDEVDKINIPVIKAFRVNNNFNYSILKKYQNCAYLLDAYDKNEFGGTGKTFAWDKIPNEIRTKVILAGGISIDNLEQSFHDIKPNAIDVSSSLEIEPGKKDKQKLKQFFTKYNSLKENLC